MFYLLKEGHPTSITSPSRTSSVFFKVKNMPQKHWSNSLGWEVVENMHDMVLQCTKEVVKQSPFFVLFVDEVTTIDNESWIFIHEYAFNDC